MGFGRKKDRKPQKQYPEITDEDVNAELDDNESGNNKDKCTDIFDDETSKPDLDIVQSGMEEEKQKLQSDNETDEMADEESTEEPDTESENSEEKEVENKDQITGVDEEAQDINTKSENVSEDDNGPDDNNPDSEKDPLIEGEDDQVVSPEREISDLKVFCNNMQGDISEIKTNCEKLSEHMYELHKLYHNEFAGRLQKMQTELEAYRERESFKIFDDILKEIIRIYCDHEALLEKADDLTDEDTIKHIKNIFSDMEELLNDYNIKKLKSENGGSLKTGCYQISKEIPVTDENLNNTVAKSISSGFIRENRPLRKEIININKYTD